jgi:hypothetical protein
MSKTLTKECRPAPSAREGVGGTHRPRRIGEPEIQILDGHFGERRAFGSRPRSSGKKARLVVLSSESAPIRERFEVISGRKWTGLLRTFLFEVPVPKVDLRVAS